MDKIDLKNDLRIDIEIYLMGDMKLDFINFLSECFKDNFTETLSWGNFRRFQLLIQNKRSWINVYFIVYNNEKNSDLLITSFKMYEKRNFMLIIYNTNDPKSEKQSQLLYEQFLDKRNKLYEGILNDETIDKNLQRISNCNTEKIPSEALKNHLKFLTDNKNNLIYKIGFLPNLVNKKTKNLKKNDISSSALYEISQEIFFITQPDEQLKMNFQGLMSYLLKEHFNTLKMNLDNYSLLNFTLGNNSSSGHYGKKATKHNKEEILSYMKKSIDWLIVLYIAIACYKIFF